MYLFKWRIGINCTLNSGTIILLLSLRGTDYCFVVYLIDEFSTNNPNPLNRRLKFTKGLAWKTRYINTYIVIEIMDHTISVLIIYSKCVMCTYNLSNRSHNYLMTWNYVTGRSEWTKTTLTITIPRDHTTTETNKAHSVTATDSP